MTRFSKILNPQAGHPICESDYDTVNADEYWDKTSSISLEDFMLEANTSCFWQVMLPHWIPDEKKRKQFANKFWNKGAKNARKNATIGTAEKNDKLAKWIVTAANYFHINPVDYFSDMEGNFSPPPSPKPLTLGEEGRGVNQSDLGLMVLNLIIKGDSATLKRIAKICSSNEKKECEYVSEPSKYWLTFVKYIQANDQLPTRKEINLLSKINPESADKVLKRLGLNGLESSS